MSAVLAPRDQYLVDLCSELERHRYDGYRDTLLVTRGHGGDGLDGVAAIAARMHMEVVTVPWQDVDAHVLPDGSTTRDGRVYETPWWDAMDRSPHVALFDPPADRPDLAERFERFVDSEGTTLVVLAVDDMPDGLYARRSSSYRRTRP